MRSFRPRRRSVRRGHLEPPARQNTRMSAPSAASASGTAGKAIDGTMYGKNRAPASQSALNARPARSSRIDQVTTAWSLMTRPISVSRS